ncbi:MAG: glycosyltransferase, partial [Actinobacteria bacterium]|nr:glycosyltransferase [Actinomycetota bacterium]
MTLRKIRVLIVTDSLQLGGAEQVAVDVANSLDRDVHEVFFCATREDGLLRAGLSDDVEVMILGRRATWDLPKLYDFGRYTRQHQIDIIHSHGRGTMRFIALARMLGLVDA